MYKCTGKVIASFLLATGMVISASLVCNSFLKARLMDRSIIAKGLAEKEVDADLAVWPIAITATGNTLSEVNKKIESDRSIVMDFLVTQGFSKNEITLGDYELNDLLASSYRGDNIQNARYIITATVILKSHNVHLVDQVNKQKNLLVQKGVILANGHHNDPYYELTKFQDIKPEMLTTAIKNARLAAEKLAVDSGGKIGKLKKANQGVFSIVPIIQSSSDEYTNVRMSTKSIGKKIRVVATLEYFLD